MNALASSCREVVHYFAYGSNMNPDRVRERGLEVRDACGACLGGMRLVFDKVSRRHPGVAHANILYAPGQQVHGVLYLLANADEILKMDPFERAPWNYGRDAVLVRTSGRRFGGEAGGDLGAAASGGLIWAWTYFANRAVRRPGLKPPADYLAHMLAGKDCLPASYWRWLSRVATAGSGPESA